jgi:hypothetical protein
MQITVAWGSLTRRSAIASPGTMDSVENTSELGEKGSEVTLKT